MNKERYVSYDIAKLLKEKGFPQSTFICNVVYKPNGKMSFNAKSFINPYYFFKDCYIFAPTQQMACSWLKETYSIWISAIPDVNDKDVFYPNIYKRDGKMWTEIYDYSNYDSFDEPEDAIDAALEYAIKNLI